MKTKWINHLPTLRKSALLIGVTSFVLISCQKEEPESSVPETKIISELTYELDNIPLDLIAESSMNKDKSDGYVYDYHLLSTNPDDPDDEAINGSLFTLTEAVKDLIKDPAFNQIIINMAMHSETSTANLLELETTAPNYFSIINSNLNAYGTDLRQLAAGLTHRPIAPNSAYPETAILETYVPAIYVPNVKNVNPSMQPIISPNLDVDASQDESLEDYIAAWYFANPSDRQVTEFLINEQTALGTSNPVFLIDNAVTTLHVPQNPNPIPFYDIDSCIYSDSSQGGRSSSIKNNPPQNYVTATKSFSSYEHRIKGSSYRYENWTGGKSEFAVAALRIEPNGTHHWIYSANIEKVINKIKKSHISSWTWQYKWSHHAPSWTPYYNSWNFPNYQSGVNYVFWNTFERDWNRSPKSLGNATANGKTIYLSGKRKYTSEWYAWIPSTLQVHNTQFVWIDYYWAHWNNSWKSDFRLWKVYI